MLYRDAATASLDREAGSLELDPAALISAVKTASLDREAGSLEPLLTAHVFPSRTPLLVFGERVHWNVAAVVRLCVYSPLLVFGERVHWNRPNSSPSWRTSTASRVRGAGSLEP